MLCPTTVLAQQHSSRSRRACAATRSTSRSLSRFQTKQRAGRGRARLKDGKVDIVIGTHRLLSKDVHFKRLGLLVVDEEQRFGVDAQGAHQAARANVDVLTLTATPIPRTLQMAVSGLRDMSLITTPPVDRRAVRTIVTRIDDAGAREAVRARARARRAGLLRLQPRRGHLRARRALQELVPEGAHRRRARPDGARAALEQTMLDFVEGRYDMLVATAIIESGLDIPRANTIIIDRADIFGLAQLYQLRGRVGRSQGARATATSSCRRRAR